MPGPPDPATTEWVPLWTTANVGPVGPQGPQGIQGPVGPTGPQGIQGIQGPQGIQGLPGENWYSGAGVPPASIPGSLVGDWYLNTTTGDVYEQTALGTWTLRANIKGPQGVQGIQGPIGPTGPTGAPGATTAHHVNHEPGGSDQIVKLQLTAAYAANAPQLEIKDSVPLAQWVETGAPADKKKWRIWAGSQLLKIDTLDDAETLAGPAIQIARDGSLSIPANLSAAGAGGNVACKDQQNIFTTLQTLRYANPQITLDDQAAPVDTRKFNLLASGQYFYVQSVSDVGAFQQNCFRVGRAGDVNAAGRYFESGRTIAIGYSQKGAFETYLSTPAGLTGSIEWSLSGKLITINFTAAGVIASSSFIQFVIPGGYTSSDAYGGSYMTFTSIPWHAGLWNTTTPGSNVVTLYDEAATPFPGGQTYVQGSISFWLS